MERLDFVTNIFEITKLAIRKPRESFRRVILPLQHGEYSSVIIDHMETFGDDAALDATQAQTLVGTFNQENLQDSMDPHTHYSTEYVMESDYKRWKEGKRKTGIGGQPESYQSFLGRHNAEIHRMLKEGSPFLAGGLECRRLIVVKNSVVSGQNGLTEDITSKYRPLDSDGSVGGYITWPYDPTGSSFWNLDNEWLDTGLIHEAFHGIMQLFDEYYLVTDFSLKGVNLPDDAIIKIYNSPAYSRLPGDQKMFIERLMRTQVNKGPLSREKLSKPEVIQNNPGLVGIPEEWWTYSFSNRNDARKEGIMSTMTRKMGPFVTWFLVRRVVQGWSHDYFTRFLEVGRGTIYPGQDFSPNNIIVLQDKYKGKKVEVWRTSGATSDTTQLQKNLDKRIITFNPQDTMKGEINLGNPWAAAAEITLFDGRKAIPSKNGLLYIKIFDDKDQVVAWRILDVGDFCPIENATKEPPEVFRMEKIDFAEGDQTQKSFHWGINDKRIYFPFMSK